MTEACAVRLNTLRQLHLGELADASQIEAHLSHCPHCAQRLASLRQADSLDLQTFSPATASVGILERLERPKRRWFWIPAIALATALFFVARPEPTERIKGGPSIHVYVDDPSGPKAANDGIRLGTGARIQVRYQAAEHGYLFVASRDGRGQRTPLYPDTPTESLAIDGAGTLDGSIILDDAVGPERIYGFFSTVPLTWTEVDSALAQADPSDPARILQRADVAESSLLIVKE